VCPLVTVFQFIVAPHYLLAARPGIARQGSLN
jgi:hypothetical protein